MKFLHIGDLHLGRSLGDFDLIEDQNYILNQVLDIAKRYEVDAVLVAGDVYDKSVPSEAAVRLFDRFLCRLAEEGLQAFIISGNHDSDERMNFGSSLFRANGIYIAAKYEGELMHLKAKQYGAELKVVCAGTEEPSEIEKMSAGERTSGEDTLGVMLSGSGRTSGVGGSSADEVNIYLMPFIKASQVRHFFPEEEIENYGDAVRVVLKKADVDPAQKNVLVAHQFVAGGSMAAQTEAENTDPILGGSEGIATQHVGLVEKIGADCFDAFDYVALGHIHSPQAVGREEVRYSGSPLKYSLSEANHVKSVPVVTLGNKGEVQIELVPLRPMRDLRHIRGRRSQLLARENITAPEDFIYVTLTDEDVMDDAMGVFQQYYPNTVRIEYDNSHTKELQETEDVGITADVSFDELIAGFYRQIYGCEISEEERKLMRAVAGEAGIEIGENDVRAERKEKKEKEEGEEREEKKGKEDKKEKNEEEEEEESDEEIRAGSEGNRAGNEKETGKENDGKAGDAD